MSDACRPAPGSDALCIRRALSESFDIAQDRLRELVRPPKARVRPIFMRPDGALLVLGPFAPKQRLRPSGRIRQNLVYRRETRQYQNSLDNIDG